MYHMSRVYPVCLPARARRRRDRRGSVSADYLKAVLVGGFESGELPASSALLPVLARLLEFGPDDLRRACRRQQQQAK